MSCSAEEKSTPPHESLSAPPSFSVPQERVQVANGALTISRLTLSDTGVYQCVAGNKHGEVYSNAELRVIGKTESRPITTFPASAVSTWWQSGNGLNLRSDLIAWN